MSSELVRAVLGWCIVINVGLLLLWLLAFVVAHDSMYRLHSRWITLSVERFDAIHYGLMGLFKLLLLVFVIAPYIALHIVGS